MKSHLIIQISLLNSTVSTQVVLSVPFNISDRRSVSPSILLKSSVSSLKCHFQSQAHGCTGSALFPQVTPAPRHHEESDPILPHAFYTQELWSFPCTASPRLPRDSGGSGKWSEARRAEPAPGGRRPGCVSTQQRAVLTSAHPSKTVLPSEGESLRLLPGGATASPSLTVRQVTQMMPPAT